MDPHTGHKKIVAINQGKWVGDHMGYGFVWMTGLWIAHHWKTASTFKHSLNNRSYVAVSSNQSVTGLSKIRQTQPDTCVNYV